MLPNLESKHYITLKLKTLLTMENQRRSSRFVRKGLIIAVVVILLLILTAVLAFPFFERTLKNQMVQALKTRFQSDPEIESLDLSLFPTLHASGKGLKLWYHGRKDIPPMISVDRFSITSEIPNLFSDVKRLSHVQLNGLVIQIPPKYIRQEATAKPETPKPEEKRPPRAARKIPRFLISEINADGTVLKISPSRPDKDPLIFELYKLKLGAVGIDSPMKFQAVLKNAKPPGLIQTQGEFGPWNASDPGQTPVSGDYAFRNADLSVFKGIQGVLASDGQYAGVLERLDVKGTTDTPDFALQRAGSAVPLKTDFKAIVDGTSGDTLLKPVVAYLGKTRIVCDGGIIGKRGVKGKWILLEVQIQKGRIQDLLTLAVPSKPLMTGLIDFQAKFDLPPGDIDVIQKLNLEGTFEIAKAVFRNFTIQEKIEELSKKSSGKVEDAEDERVVSNMKGRFVLRNGTIYFSELSFSVPGAAIVLAGSYGIGSQVIDFAGELRMLATISQTQKGIKSFLLKVVDPFFKKKGYGTVLPIKITGTRSSPKFGLNFGGNKKKESK